jgi:biopolymer transport protein ExbD
MGHVSRLCYSKCTHMNSGKRRRTRRLTQSDATIEMSAMIDVVFLLLIFFIATINPTDVLAKLQVDRPAPPPDKTVADPELMKIEILSDSYLLNRTRVSLERIEEVMIKIPKSARTQNVIIICHMDSSHSRLIRALDLCSKLEFKNLSLATR